MDCFITHFGAVADVSINSAASIQKAIDTAHQAGGGTVVVPAGQSFMCGSIVLKSFVRLILEPGSNLKASGDIADYVNYEHLELFAKSDFCRFWIFARDSSRITIEGGGTLDGNSAAYVTARMESHSVAKSPRAQAIVFLGCQDITVRDIHIINTPSWALRPAGCDRVLIEGVSILNDLTLVNSDGIDVDCSRSVRIANCHVEAGDDAISIKGRREIAAQYGACEDVTITGCVLESHCCAFRLGCESHVDFRRIIFSSSTIRRSHRGIALDCRDEALIEDILITDISVETIHSHRIWWHQGEPIWICQVPYVAGHYGENSKVASMRNIVFRNISIVSEQGIYIQGADDERHPSDILLEDIRIHLHKRTPHPVGLADPRPNRPGFMVAGHKGIEEETPWGSIFKHDVPAFFLDRVENITLRNCRVTWADNMPVAYSHALEVWNARGIVLENFQGESARKELQPLLLDGVARQFNPTEVLNR